MPRSLNDGPRHEGERARGARRTMLRASLWAGVLLLLAVQPRAAWAQRVRITNISDVSFGLISNLQADSSQSQNLCVFSQSTAGAYSISASGSGPGSSFALSSGSDALVYEVQWSSQSGQTSGTSLAPGVPLTGQTSAASQQTCNSGPATSASLSIILRASQLSQARQGNYSGSLTLLVAAE
ncbi:MAG: hypothetical protein M3Q19_15730 [Pseudomonadota bacterium]|nr:hypothetical protein [Pseudomonadota bacterium]